MGRLVLATALLLPGFAFGQAFTGSISGIVTDSSGAVITGAKVTVTDVSRNTTFETTSNDTGLYVVTQLPPATYRVNAGAAGFRTFVLDHLPLSTQSGRGEHSKILSIGEFRGQAIYKPAESVYAIDVSGDARPV